jgi:hypothetical protein
VQIELQEGEMPPGETFAEAKRFLASHPGPAPVEVVVQAGNGVATPRLRSRSLRVDAGTRTVEGLGKLFGPRHVRLVRAGHASPSPEPSPQG